MINIRAPSNELVWSVQYLVVASQATYLRFPLILFALLTGDRGKTVQRTRSVITSSARRMAISFDTRLSVMHV